MENLYTDVKQQRVCTIENVKRRVWRTCILMLRSKGFVQLKMYREQYGELVY